MKKRRHAAERKEATTIYERKTALHTYILSDCGCSIRNSREYTCFFDGSNM